jgi:hypothetical protein
VKLEKLEEELEPQINADRHRLRRGEIIEVSFAIVWLPVDT